MANGNSNEQVQMRNRIFRQANRLFGKAIALLALVGLLVGESRGFGDETSFTEYQVKSLFLLNFAKYVDWPTEAFATSNAPIVIGVIGQNKFGGELDKTVSGKSVDGREIVIRPFGKEEDFRKCHILFVCVSEKKRLDEILGHTKTMPVLTVGETEQFLPTGGIINFKMKESKVRLEINLTAAQKSKLQISSKLLNVADVVRGK